MLLRLGLTTSIQPTRNPPTRSAHSLALPPRGRTDSAGPRTGSSTALVSPSLSLARGPTWRTLFHLERFCVGPVGRTRRPREVRGRAQRNPRNLCTWRLDSCIKRGCSRRGTKGFKTLAARRFSGRRYRPQWREAEREREKSTTTTIHQHSWRSGLDFRP